MADLAPARAHHAADLAHRIGREIVVQHEVLLVGAFQRIDELLVFAGAQRGDDKRLGLAAREQRAAMGARKHADFRDDRTHGLEIAAVDAQAGFDHGAAHHAAFQFLEQFAEQIGRDLARFLADEGRLAASVLIASMRSCRAPFWAI